jgi:hypothetical protein
MRPFPTIAAMTLLAACTDPSLDSANGQQNAEQNAEFADTDLPGKIDPAAPKSQNRSSASSPIQSGPNQASPPAPAKPAVDPSKGMDGPDQCNAGKYQYLLGQPRSRIPDAATGPGTRVTCTTCAMTMDYSPSRLNILYDEKTEIIKEVKCG